MALPLIIAGVAARAGAKKLAKKLVEKKLNKTVNKVIKEKSVKRNAELTKGEPARLNNLMKEAFMIVSNQERVRIKYNANITKKALSATQHQDRDFYLNSLSFIQKGNPSKGYEYRMKRHNKWMSRK